MPETPRPFVLLDPPSSGTFCRRAALREKDCARAAAFPSIDLILLSGSIREACLEPVYIDAQLDGLSWDDVAQRLRTLQPAGILSLTSTSRLDEELTSLGRLKKEIGGAAVYIIATILLQKQKDGVQRVMERHPWLDGMVLNVAEHNFADIIRTGSAGVAPFNVALRKTAKESVVGGAHPTRLDRLSEEPLPYGRGSDQLGSDINLLTAPAADLIVPEVQVRYGDSLHIPRPEHALFRDPRYSFPQSRRGPVTCTQFSFGCPFTCEFCIDNQQYRKMLYRHVDDMVDEMVEMDRLGFREVYFKDLTFGLNYALTAEFLRKVIERRLKLRWLCTTRIDVARHELLDLMRQAGCYGIEFGVEHHKESTRLRVDKRISAERIQSVFADCRRLGLETTAFIMLAFEDDSEQDVRDTIRFAKTLKADYVSFNVVNALPGTEYAERARREGFLHERTADYSFAVSNIRHRHLTPEQVSRLYREAVRSTYLRPGAILRRLLNLQSWHELRKLVRLGRGIVWGG